LTPISSAIFSILTKNTEVTNIVEDDVQPEHIHQGDRSYPAIVYQIVGDSTDCTYSGTSGLQNSTVIIVAMSASAKGGSYAQLQSMKTSIMDTLDGFQGVANGIMVNGIFLEGYREGSFEQSGTAEEDLIYEGEFHFNCWFQNS